MLYYNRIDLKEGTDITKSIDSKECIVCYYWYLNYKFKFQKSVYNGRHDLLVICTDISEVAIITVKGVNYLFLFFIFLF